MTQPRDVVRAVRTHLGAPLADALEADPAWRRLGPMIAECANGHPGGANGAVRRLAALADQPTLEWAAERGPSAAHWLYTNIAPPRRPR